MHDFETLMIEHDHLDALAVALTTAMSSARSVDALLAIRAELSIGLEEHLSKEDAFLYNGLIDARQPDFPAEIARFHSSFATLAADWTDYLQSWDAECIEAEWQEFAHETVLMMQRLRARIAAENALLYPMALRTNHIRLRMAA